MDTLDIFISYQRDEEETVKELYAHLTTAGFSVWIDTEGIRTSDRWPFVINDALNQCYRLILLLTPESMNSVEVFNEWFFFYQNRKPIHCLMVKSCSPHYQLLSFQYIDWTDKENRDWERLVNDLKEEWKRDTIQDELDIVVSEYAPAGGVSKSMKQILQAVQKKDKAVLLSASQLDAILRKRPNNLEEYYLARIAEWSSPKYKLDTRFVRLSLLLDRGEDIKEPRWGKSSKQYNDIRDVLGDYDDSAMVLLGKPGCGKSTILRRLEMDYSIDSLRSKNNKITFFIQLNQYRQSGVNETLPPPKEWLAKRWKSKYPALPDLDKLIENGAMFFLLDGVNEIPHADEQAYRDFINIWRQFLIEVICDNPGNRVLFSCRTLDYSAPLSSPVLRVPQVVVEPMEDNKIHQFLQLYLPAYYNQVWRKIANTSQLGLYRTPFFLKLLTENLQSGEQMPSGLAELFTNYIRNSLKRELFKKNPLFEPMNGLLTSFETRQLLQNQWRNSIDLPERGMFLKKIREMAFAMQAGNFFGESMVVRIEYETALVNMHFKKAGEVIQAGVDLNILDLDIAQNEVMYYHQTLQEYFSARECANTLTSFDTNLLFVEWRASEVTPTLEDTLYDIAESDPLPPLPSTGWEETIIMATAMIKEPDSFIVDMAKVNLSLAGRCIAAPGVRVSKKIKNILRKNLLRRIRDDRADIRARISAGLTLGYLGHPEFASKNNAGIDYIIPPTVKIAGGEYKIGCNRQDHTNPLPATTVLTQPIYIGQYHVTNAEFQCFITADGYNDELWWETDDAKSWRNGENSVDEAKDMWREHRKNLVENPQQIIEFEKTGKITKEDAMQFFQMARMTDDEYEEMLESWFPVGKMSEPRPWRNEAYNNPLQPVTGITYYEADAYCKWLSSISGKKYRLPTEEEYEIAAAGKSQRPFPWGECYSPLLCNSYETHIRHTSPIGVFTSGNTPEGIGDICGNAWCWTSSQSFRTINGEQIVDKRRRVNRGGSWHDNKTYMKTTARTSNLEYDWHNWLGFRIINDRSIS